MKTTKKPRIFIDGAAGTTGLGIRQRLEQLPVELLSIAPEKRKYAQARAELMALSDLTILCLPDDAAREAVKLILNLPDTTKPRVIDASTAFRTHADWVYGFAELNPDQHEKIKKAQWVANPGCYATGAIALLHPLIAQGILKSDYPLSINAISGYSGGGHAMIDAHNQNHGPAFELYALNLAHKHIPEIVHYTGLTKPPLFVPSVGHFERGMIVSVPLHLEIMNPTLTGRDIFHALSSHYAKTSSSPLSYVHVLEDDSPRLVAETLAGKDYMELRVHENSATRQAVLTARLDNLGKGASGAALQNIITMLDIPLEGDD